MGSQPGPPPAAGSLAGIVILIMLVIGPIACATAIKTGLLS